MTGVITLIVLIGQGSVLGPKPFTTQADCDNASTMIVQSIKQDQPVKAVCFDEHGRVLSFRNRW